MAQPQPGVERSVTGQELLTLRPGDLPDEGSLPEWATWSGATLTVIGDDSGHRQVFVFGTEEVVIAGTEPGQVVAAARQNGEVETSPFAISHMLQTGFVPMTATMFEGLRRIGMGDVLEVYSRQGRFDYYERADYPWLTYKSRQDQTPDTARLAELIRASVDASLAEVDGRAALMMSSGKDSVGLAIVIAEGGHDVPAMTFKHADGDREPVFAERFCRQLGLSHRTIEMPTASAEIAEPMRRFFTGAVFPSVDHALIPVILMAAASGLDGGGLIDGGGNDTYMMHLPSRTRRAKLRFRIRGRRVAEMMHRLTRVDSPINYLARSGAGVLHPGRLFRPRDVEAFYSQAIDAYEHWYKVSAATKHLSKLDRAAMRLVREAEGSRTNDKVRLVAQAYGMKPLLPYLDQDLANYYFHLPVEARYDEPGHKNKTLLRQLLDERLDYAASGVGDGYFAFDGARFISAHRDLVRDEIFACALWEPAVRPLVNGWLDSIAKRPYLFHVLLPLYLVSGWHNHSRYLRRGE